MLSAPIEGMPCLRSFCTPPFGRFPDSIWNELSPRLEIFQPLGILPNSESSNESGNKSLISSGSPVERLSAFALTGSKSINHDLKSAFAISSSVSLVFRFSSIFSSRVPSIFAIAFCMGRSGTEIFSDRKNEVGLAIDGTPTCEEFESKRCFPLEVWKK